MNKQADEPLLGHSLERSDIERAIKTLADRLQKDGHSQIEVIYALQQVLVDVCLENPGDDVELRFEVMQHLGNTFLAIVEEIEDKTDAVERNRAVGLADHTRS